MEGREKKIMYANQLMEGIYEVKLPLPGSSLKELSSYIIKGEFRSCIIDVGFATEECDRILRETVKELGLKKENTDILITHSHRDHCGNLPSLYREFGSVCCSLWDSRRISNIDNLSEKAYLRQHFLTCGIPASFLDQMTGTVDLGEPVPMEKIRVLSEGDVLNYGVYQFRVIDLSGHMPGQIGLYDAVNGILFPGDHVLNKITPNIGFYGDNCHCLLDYLDNLRKIRNLPVKHVFPAHRGEIKNMVIRVDEILEHHEERLDEISGILYRKPMCAYEMAGKVTWHYNKGNFPAYPVFMKWMASAEMLAHLQYLYERGEINRQGGEDETYLYHI